MPATSSPPSFVQAPNATRRVAELRELLATRRPRPEAEHAVQVSAPLSRTCYWSFTRVAGRPDDVLDYTAWLLAEDRATPHRGKGALELEAVEHDEPRRLVLVLSRALYDPA